MYQLDLQAVVAEMRWLVYFGYGNIDHVFTDAIEMRETVLSVSLGNDF
jgi:hypothetical protein